MAKRYGEAYDPEMRESEHGARLYQTWKRLRKHPYVDEWGCYPAFYCWAIESGYVIGARLVLKSESAPYGPDNCLWHIKEFEDDFEPIPQSWPDEWNKTVNRIRKHYGMPPIGGDNHD